MASAERAGFMMTQEDHVLLRVCFLEFLFYISLLAILFFPVSPFSQQ